MYISICISLLIYFPFSIFTFSHFQSQFLHILILWYPIPSYSHSPFPNIPILQYPDYYSHSYIPTCTCRIFIFHIPIWILLFYINPFPHTPILILTFPFNHPINIYTYMYILLFHNAPFHSHLPHWLLAGLGLRWRRLGFGLGTVDSTGLEEVAGTVWTITCIV